ncbi:hypothetical protein Pcinc_009126 [Petrolisthes cinctipes]|uniref:Aminoacyl tRNA synthase complex-interacting multifunctional protein 1 n=1 Tax=Petrolisthes cinctipes TaxID=88211 RepID=A0AAE1G7H3_PETCI|nr:hypothetical protein Pcinc_009126 [Petrolisthes cinctipes]
MASPEVLNRLEQRAVQAEQMIETLTNQIGQLQVCVADTQKEKLRQENLQLRQEVERLKKSLLSSEKAQGITQYYDFNKQSTGSGTVNDTPIDIQPSKQPTPTATAATATATPPIGKVEKKEASEKKADKKEKKKIDGGEKGGKGKKAEDEGPVDVSRLDFRVGRIVSAKKHPDADTLYVEEVDVGENKMRTVVSGLVKFVPVEEMQNRMAVLLCNLKPAKMRGITSEAMVMCASTPEKVEILTPPVGSQPGDIVQFEGYTRNPDAVLNPKKKIFETCAPDLQTDANKVAVYKGVAFTIPGKGEPVAQGGDQQAIMSTSCSIYTAIVHRGLKRFGNRINFRLPSRKVEVDIPYRCLIFVPEMKSWGGARKHCISIFADLVVVQESQVQGLADFIRREKDKLRGSQHSNYVLDNTATWVGVRKKVWFDRRPVKHWRDSEPDENNKRCGSLKEDGKISDERCIKCRFFVCSKSATFN